MALFARLEFMCMQSADHRLINYDLRNPILSWARELNQGLGKASVSSASRLTFLLSLTIANKYGLRAVSYVWGCQGRPTRALYLETGAGDT